MKEKKIWYIKCYSYSTYTKKKIKHPEDVVKECEDLANSDREMLLVFYLNSNKQIREKSIIFIGTLTSCNVHPREVFKPAIFHSDHSILVVHNHPGGSVEPTLEDKMVAYRLRYAGEILGIELVDFVIVTKDEYYSFAMKSWKDIYKIDKELNKQGGEK